MRFHRVGVLFGKPVKAFNQRKHFQLFGGKISVSDGGKSIPQICRNGDRQLEFSVRKHFCEQQNIIGMLFQVKKILFGWGFNLGQLQERQCLQGNQPFQRDGGDFVDVRCSL